VHLAKFDFEADLHCFSLDGLRLVVDVVSGAVHVLDQPAWEFVRELQANGGDVAAVRRQLAGSYPGAVLEEIEAELGQLAAEGTMFSPDPWRGQIGQPEPERALTTPVVKSLCLHLAHDCNLRCAYCFGSGGGFGGERGLMSETVAKAAIDFLLQSMGSRRHGEVDFFGGEPLLNFPVLEAAMAYARFRQREAGKELRFTLTTNGVLLTPAIREYLNREQISLVLSLDGRPEVHDRMRQYADGSGSYQEVLAAALALAESREQQNYYLRGTFTRHNRNFAEDVLHLADLGFRQLSLEPVVAPEQEEYALRADDLPGLYAEYERLALEYRRRETAGRGFRFFHFELELDHGPCVAKRVKGCGAGVEYLAVTPEGDLYPCHQFVGRPEYRIGSVLGGERDCSLQHRFQSADMYHKPACSRCWARFYCGGGCHANAVSFNQDLLQPWPLGCDLQRKRLELAIFLQAARRQELAG